MHHDHHHGATPSQAAPERAYRDVDELVLPGDAAAAPACLIPIKKEEAHRLAGAAAFKRQGQQDNTNFDADHAGEQQLQPTDSERFARLRARLALAGWTLVQCETAVAGTALFLASRWGHVRELPSFAAIEAFARQIGAAL